MDTWAASQDTQTLWWEPPNRDLLSSTWIHNRPQRFTLQQSIPHHRLQSLLVLVKMPSRKAHLKCSRELCHMISSWQVNLPSLTRLLLLVVMSAGWSRLPSNH
jgi:hypothetical protein